MAVVRVTAVLRPYTVRWRKQPPGQRVALFKKGRQAWWYPDDEEPARYIDRHRRYSEKKQFKREGLEGFYCRICKKLHVPRFDIPLKEAGAPMTCVRCYYNKIWHKAMRLYPKYQTRKFSDDIEDKLMTLGVALYAFREIENWKKRLRGR